MQRGGKGREMKQGYSILLCSNVLWQEVIMRGTVIQYPMYLRRGLENGMGDNGNVLD